jgi:ectoine hydroxylase-related dioxygenase (phytanoyl-CoA dioxygenase family)
MTLDRINPLDLQTVGSRCLLKLPWCQDLAIDLRDRVAREIPELTHHLPVQCTYFQKTPQQNWLVAWHQDRSMPVRESVESAEWTGWTEKEGMTFAQPPDLVLRNMIAIRLHLDAVTMDNGALRVIPGSHRSGTLTPAQIQQLRETQSAIAGTTDKGAAFVMRPLLLHASAKSIVPAQRRVLHFLYGPSVWRDRPCLTTSSELGLQ